MQTPKLRSICHLVYTVPLALPVLIILACTHGVQGVRYDPCAAPVQVQRGANFTIGLLFIAGVNASEINRLVANDIKGVCSAAVQQSLAVNYTSRVAIFNPLVDRLTVFRVPYPDIIFNMVNTTTNQSVDPSTMTVMAFRGNITSPAAYIVSGNTTYTHGLGFVISLALLVRMEKGNLQALQWFDQTCNECGGKGSFTCIKTPAALSSPIINSCATPLINCTCSPGDSSQNTTSCNFADSKFKICSTGTNVAWSGTDAKESAFRTGSQLTRINAYSLTSIFISGYDKLKSFYDQGVVGTWSSINGDIGAQYVDFGGGLGTQQT